MLLSFRALSESGNFEFSFSGLKSAVLNYLNSKSQKSEDINKADVAASFQKAIRRCSSRKN